LFLLYDYITIHGAKNIKQSLSPLTSKIY